MPCAGVWGLRGLWKWEVPLYFVVDVYRMAVYTSVHLGAGVYKLGANLRLLLVSRLTNGYHLLRFVTLHQSLID